MNKQIKRNTYLQLGCLGNETIYFIGAFFVWKKNEHFIWIACCNSECIFHLVFIFFVVVFFHIFLNIVCYLIYLLMYLRKKSIFHKEYYFIVSANLFLLSLSLVIFFKNLQFYAWLYRMELKTHRRFLNLHCEYNTLIKRARVFLFSSASRKSLWKWN